MSALQKFKKIGFTALVFSGLVLVNANSNIINNDHGNSNGKILTHKNILANIVKHNTGENTDIATVEKEDKFSFIEEKSNQTEMAYILGQNGFGFEAIAVTVEGYANKPYYDPGGLNVGIGYCISKRIEALGSDKVIEDLTKAGFSDSEVTTLLSKNKKEIKKINVTNKQAILLLHQVAPEYTDIARSNITPEVFDSLSQREQNVWTYFAWNTGENMRKFSTLINGIKEGNHNKIFNNVSPSYKDSNGEWQKNERLGVALQAALIHGESELANGKPYDFPSVAQKVKKEIIALHKTKNVAFITKVDLTSVEPDNKTDSTVKSNILKIREQYSSKDNSLKNSSLKIT